MRSFDSICLGLILQGSLFLMSVPAWSQDESRPVPVPAATGPGSNASANDDESASVDDSSGRMLTPPPVSGQSYPIVLTSQERSNYLRGGLAFTSAYTDNAVGPVNGHPVSDISYSVWPTVALDETTTRSAPGFDLRARVHLLSAREFLERGGRKCVHQFPVPPEPARDVLARGMAFRKVRMCSINPI